ncbi:MULTISPECIES: hypothetical protein [unclassified Frondihabitans]|uniref:hypothetical protein n=1 Tax=unclassified Frondihabitans TaxID=2626248 RepID=UPI000F512B96|nr:MULTISPECIES: hypothetical protein [unclassified Frondihabitans]RPE78965.1 hypothetical protein EDF37_1653 [Frondihabitans sp. PhB153]RPF09246.1 hypothetical protein EDF39_1655 [Frondihabitans sp. PhB161]
MSSLREGAHEKGRVGVFKTKRWLESTTHIELSFDAYNYTTVCTLDLLDGIKTYDLMGKFLASKEPLYVEVKTYDSVGGGQPAEFWEFLAHAYSATVKAQAKGLGDPKYNFMWVTTHPFEQTAWIKLATRERLKEAVEKFPRWFTDHTLDEETLTRVAARLWVLVVNTRQHELNLTQAELDKVHGVLGRRGGE